MLPGKNPAALKSSRPGLQTHFCLLPLTDNQIPTGLPFLSYS